MITSNLRSAGPSYKTILSLSVLIWSVLLPITLYKKVYAFSVGYGYSVMVTSIVLLYIVFPSTTTTSTTDNNNIRHIDYYHRLPVICCAVYGGTTWIVPIDSTIDTKNEKTYHNDEWVHHKSHHYVSITIIILFYVNDTGIIQLTSNNKRDINTTSVVQ